MSEPINFVITDVGKNALYLAQENGVKLSLGKVGLGAGQYIASADRVQMAAKFTENGIAAGSIEAASFALRFTMIMNYGVEKAVSEIGLYTSAGVLFAVASKPNGFYFKLYPGIDYVATFGLVLEQAVDPALIEFIVDGQGAAAIQLMQQHSIDEDPHPQYKEYARLALEGHLAETDPHPQYALKTFVNSELEKLSQTVNNVVDVASLFFPPVLSVGTGLGADSIALRAKGRNYTLTDRSIVYLSCPESTHEAWSSTREANQIKTTVFNREGTNRIPYTGRVNWAMIDTERALINKGFLAADTQLIQEIKSGVIEVGETLSIFRESWEAMDYTDARVVILISPEGAHEAWNLERAKDQIKLNIFHRSGTNRIPYTGRVNWALFKVNPLPDFTGAYPRQITTGFASSANFTIPSPAGVDFTDPNFVPIITPEGAHEGWSIIRTGAGFVVNVFNRSGTNSAAYTGRVNWAVFAIKKPLNRKVYYKGEHAIVVPPGKTAIIDLFGPGGGAGGSIYSGGIYNPDGNDAGNTQLTFGSVVLTAGGGKKATGGVWGNGSSYFNGQPGLGGLNSIVGLTGAFKLMVDIPGNPGIEGSRWERQKGGDPTSLVSGLSVDNRGGMGAWGIGDERWSFGGGAGSGGYLQTEFTNSSDQAVTLMLDVGASGTGWKAGGNAGDDGGQGFAVISMEL